MTSLSISAIFIAGIAGIVSMTDTAASAIGFPSAPLTITSNWLSPIFAAVGFISMMVICAAFAFGLGFAGACAEADDASIALSAATLTMKIVCRLTVRMRLRNVSIVGLLLLVASARDHWQLFGSEALPTSRHGYAGIPAARAHHLSCSAIDAAPSGRQLHLIAHGRHIHR